VLSTTDLGLATSFYRQLGLQVLHHEAEYAIVTRDGVELHQWLCSDRTLAEQSLCGIQVTGLEALYQEDQTLAQLVPEAPSPRQEFVMCSMRRPLALNLGMLLGLFPSESL
jgi:hypothetical protein